MAKTKKTYVARDPRALGQTVVLWLYIRLASTAFNMVANAIQLHGLSRVPPDAPVSMSETLPGLETADLISGLSGLVLLATMLVSGFLTLKWIYRVTMNSHTLASGLRVSPPGSIGWWWGLWIATSTIDNTSFRLQMRAHDAAASMFVAGLDLVSDLLWVVLCLVLIQIVRRLSAQQSNALNTTAFD